MDLTDSEFFKLADTRAKQYEQNFPNSNPYLSFRRGYEIATREISPSVSHWRTDNPEINKWVIVYSPNCKYPACAAYWNGTKWKDDEMREIYNVEFWAEVITPHTLP
jgi:hypothetical protein